MVIDDVSSVGAAIVLAPHTNGIRHDNARHNSTRADAALIYGCIQASA